MPTDIGSERHFVNTSDSILVLTTGGTIDKQYFDALNKYQITDSIVTRLLEVARVRHPFQVEEVLRKDSIDITEEDRAQLVEHVRRAPVPRIVITHGTDTMTVTASALAAIIGKTIVLTGALAPARFSESDAAFNLGMAFATAQTAAPGVYIAINGSVFRGDEVTKNHALGYFTRKQDQ
ncbi:MAG TPA: asparaginase domain-containing protein [Steroidobacteraceae bacterium]|nr:asparaginase domain-containing protein [Steroidobacteraceae bacterium]